MSFPPLTHQIHWRNRTNGRTGIGPAKFDHARAREIADELNDEYPDFEHLAVACDATPQFQSAPAPTPSELAFTPRHFVPMIGSDTCPIAGKHLGDRMDKVPSDYCDWLFGQHWLPKRYPEVHDYILRNKKAIDQDVERMDG